MKNERIASSGIIKNYYLSYKKVSKLFGNYKKVL